MMKLDEILQVLRSESNPNDLVSMAKMGITPDKAFGTKLPVIRKLAKQVGKDHELALQLWNLGYRETQILASLVDVPEKVTQKQMDSWAREFAYWEICDQCCMNLFYRLPKAPEKAVSWSQKKPEQFKRAGFALMAILAWKGKSYEDDLFIEFFPDILRGAEDARGPVKKAVSWAIRSIGKRNYALNQEAIGLAKKIEALEAKSAKWIAKDALKELTDPIRVKKLREASL